MRSVVLMAMLAGCGFDVSGTATDASGDGSGGSDVIPSDPDAMIDAMIDAPEIDAPRATITYVQGASGVGASQKATFVLAQPIVAGDLCVLGIGVQGGDVDLVTDISGNTYTSESNTGGMRVYVAANMAAAGANAVSVAFDQTTGFTGAVACYRGLATVSPIDGKSASSGTGNSMDSGGTQPTQHAHDLLVGIAASNGAMTPGNGATTRTNTGTSLIADREVDATGSYHATATSFANVTWSMTVLALEAAD